MNRGLVPQPAGSAGRKGRRSVNQCKTESTSSQGESTHQKKKKRKKENSNWEESVV